MYFQNPEMFNLAVPLLNINCQKKKKKSHERRCFQHPGIYWVFIIVEGGQLQAWEWEMIKRYIITPHDILFHMTNTAEGSKPKTGRR